MKLHFLTMRNSKKMLISNDRSNEFSTHLPKAPANTDTLTIIDLADPSSSENQFGALPRAASTYLRPKET